MNNRAIVGLALIISLLVLLSGCATNGMTRAERDQAYEQYIVQQKLESVETVNTFRFHGWNDLSDRHLIINAGVNKYYLISLRSLCYELDDTLGIRVNSTGSLLRARFDSISIPGKFHQRCYIDRIYEISRQQRDELVRLHKSDDTAEKEVIVEQQQANTAD